MNDAQNKTYNNQREARKALYMEACIPLARKFYGAMTKKLQPYYSDNPVICIDTDAIAAIQEDRALVIERLTKAVAGGLLTQNEAREELGYKPSEDPGAGALKIAAPGGF
jgi:phage portal protein BeeE